MSGGIHFLIVASGTDTTRFELGNTFDYTALKIIQIINEYLPADKKLRVSEKLITDAEDCRAYLLKNETSK